MEGRHRRSSVSIPMTTRVLRIEMMQSPASQATLVALPSRKYSVCETAAYLGVSKSWLDKRRLYGDGPRYIKIGRRVCYDVADLELFVASLKRHHTSEPTSNR
jgi:predicted DNA-binding transcriptional regulator AlpA